ncbi:unnamed protein product [Closterium sp. NIES-54]
MPAESTPEMKGARTMHVLTVGYEKERLTIMMAMTAGGLKLPPYVAFKRKTMPKIPVPQGVVIRAHEKGWMDKKLIQDWTTQVLVVFLNSMREVARGRKDALLVLDLYQGHITEAVGQTMKLFKLTHAVISGSCTSLVQQLDVLVNHGFKAGVHHRYSTWFEDEGIGYTTPACEFIAVRITNENGMN